MDTQCQKKVSLRLSGEEETGNAGEQWFDKAHQPPVRNSLTDWNWSWGLNQPPISHDYSKKLCLGKPNGKHERANFSLFVNLC
jgi:hypothetical protein